MSASLSRFQITEGNPQQPPHKCSVCGSINGTFIDFGLDLEFYGTVYLCLENCLNQLANELGYRSPAQHHVALEEIEILRGKLNSALDQNEEFRNALVALRRIDTNNSRPHDSASADVAEGKLDNHGASKAESGSPEPSAKQGSSDLLDDDGLNDLLNTP